jgi:uncharacterized protein (DUF305 family)
MNSYSKLATMLVVSFIVMYAVMFMNVDQASHIMFSYTRTYMSILMVSPMAVMMILFMWPMYKNKKANYGIIIISILTFGVSLSMLRNQTLIKDLQYMKAMIPHHSSAIMVSEQAILKDPETRKLAARIIKSQKREIAEMQKLIEHLEKEN